MRTSGSVVTYRAGHSIRQRLINHGYGQHPVFPLINVPVLLHNTPAMEPIHDSVQVLFFGIIADDRLGIAILQNTKVEKFHFRRSDAVGIVCIGDDLFKGHSDNMVCWARKSINYHP